MAAATAHSRGAILLKTWDGVCVSAHLWGPCITVANPGSEARAIDLELTGADLLSETRPRTVPAVSLDTVDRDFTDVDGPGPQVENDHISLAAPPCSLVAVTVRSAEPRDAGTP